MKLKLRILAVFSLALVSSSTAPTRNAKALDALDHPADLTALGEAMLIEEFETFSFLLRNSPTINQENINRLLYIDSRYLATPLHFATFSNKPRFVSALVADPRVDVNYGAIYDTHLTGIRRETPLHAAISNDSEELTRILLASPRIRPNTPAVDEENFLSGPPFTWAINRRLNRHNGGEYDETTLRIIEMLLQHPAVDVNSPTGRDYRGEAVTALDLAGQARDRALAALLIRYGAIKRLN